MARQGRIPQSILAAVQSARQREQAELAQADAAEAARVYALTATGSGDMDELFSLARRFRLVFVRCHFAGASGVSLMTIAVESVHGSPYNALLATISNAGVGSDVSYRVAYAQLPVPSPWTFQEGDAVRVSWQNPAPGSIAWGLEVGLAPA